MNGVTTKSIIILLLLLAAASCSRHSWVSETLAHAEAVMEEHPDSALSILQAVPDSALVTDRDRALHALLLSQALIKTRSEVENDSLILSAIEYFDQHSDNAHLATANTYYSRYLVGMGRYDEAMPVALDGLDEAILVEDTLLMARLHEIIADIYYLSYDVQKELEHRDYAVKYYKSTGHELSYKYSLIELARCYNDNYREQDAKSLLDSVKPLFCEADTFMKLKYKSIYIPYLMLHKDYSTVKNIINECVKYLDGMAVDEDIYCSLGKIYVETNQPDSVEFVMQEAMNNPDLDINEAGLQFLELDYLSMTGNYIKAYYKYDSLFQLQNEIVEKVLRNNVETSRTNYYKAKQNEQRQHNEKLKIFILIGIVFLFAISIMIILIVKLKLRKRDLIQQENLNEIQHLMHRLGEEHSKNALISEQSELIDMLIKKRFATIDRLCHEYYEKKILRFSETPYIKVLKKKYCLFLQKTLCPNLRTY